MNSRTSIDSNNNDFEQRLEGAAKAGKEVELLNFKKEFDEELCLTLANKFGYKLCYSADLTTALFLKQYPGRLLTR